MTVSMTYTVALAVGMLPQMMLACSSASAVNISPSPSTTSSSLVEGLERAGQVVRGQGLAGTTWWVRIAVSVSLSARTASRVFFGILANASSVGAKTVMPSAELRVSTRPASVDGGDQGLEERVGGGGGGDRLGGHAVEGAGTVRGDGGAALAEGAVSGAHGVGGLLLHRRSSSSDMVSEGAAGGLVGGGVGLVGTTAGGHAEGHRQGEGGETGLAGNAVHEGTAFREGLRGCGRPGGFPGVVRHRGRAGLV